MIKVRWLACAAVFVMILLTWRVLGIVHAPIPLFVLGGVMVFYNVLFRLSQRDWTTGDRDVERNIFLQITVDLIALTLLLYLLDLPRNPFLFFFVFHMIIASMFLHRRVPYFVAGMAVTLVGTVMLAEYLQWLPSHPVDLPLDPSGGRPLDGVYLLSVFVAFASTMWITVYFTTSIHRYVDRAHAEIRQKEKMLGIGQLVAGFAHQIANPLDGVQNCLHRIGERVRDDPHLADYVQMMGEALNRIERTAKRVQAFARPRGITLEPTDVNQAVDATLGVLGTHHGPSIRIQTDLGEVSAVRGDPYTLQEVLFNLCTNALAAMPEGGTLTLRTRTLGRRDEEGMGAVTVDVSDTGVGIPRGQLEKIFEPFYTTRAESGGTGLGLGLCRMLISEMGGRIDVRTVLGQGTTFAVVLHPIDNESSAKRK